MDPNNKKFLALQKKWYAKARNSGFQDHEAGPGKQDLPLTTKHSGLHFSRKRAAHVGEGTPEEYYRLAGHFLYDYNFETDYDQEVWKLHAEGVSVRKTVVVMQHRGINTYKRQVDETVRRLAFEMKKLYDIKK
jgi:hypothetical protein